MWLDEVDLTLVETILRIELFIYIYYWLSPVDIWFISEVLKGYIWPHWWRIILSNFKYTK